MFGIQSFLVKSIIGLSIVGGTLGGAYAYREEILSTEVGQKIERIYKLKYVYYYRTMAEIKYYITGVKDMTESYSRDLKELQKNTQTATDDSDVQVASDTVTKKSGGLSQYVERSRDTARIAHLVQISTVLGAYFADHVEYPPNSPTGCIDSNELDKSYFSGKLPPVDPIDGRKSEGCSGDTDMTYVYRTATDEIGTTYFVIGAEMEYPESGNSSESIDAITPSSELKKGAGKMYYIVK